MADLTGIGNRSLQKMSGL